jgi:hypothetical protein
MNDPKGSFRCMNHRQSTHHSACDKPVKLHWWTCMIGIKPGILWSWAEHPNHLTLGSPPTHRATPGLKPGILWSWAECPNHLTQGSPPTHRATLGLKPGILSSWAKCPNHSTQGSPPTHRATLGLKPGILSSWAECPNHSTQGSPPTHRATPGLEPGILWSWAEPPHISTTDLHQHTGLHRDLNPRSFDPGPNRLAFQPQNSTNTQHRITPGLEPEILWSWAEPPHISTTDQGYTAWGSNPDSFDPGPNLLTFRPRISTNTHGYNGTRTQDPERPNHLTTDLHVPLLLKFTSQCNVAPGFKLNQCNEGIHWLQNDNHFWLNSSNNFNKSPYFCLFENYL